MDALAPLPSAAASPTRSVAPADLLRARARWRRLGLPFVFVNAGLLLTLAMLWKLHPSTLRATSWGHLPLVWAIGTGLTFLGALALWVRGRRSAPLQGARSLDENLRAMNRLEAAALLESHADPLARAQREETTAFLADHAPRQRGPDSLEVLFWAAAALVLVHLATLTAWTRPWQRPAAAPVKATPTPPPAAPPKATITWKTPKSEIKASPVEEVPLEAVADSASGLRDLVLEASVNGEPRPGTPVPSEALAKAGSHPIQTSLYLDQLEAQPYDMVSYFLRAKRIAKGDLPKIVSPVQFVEIKPFRDDVRELPGADGTGCFALLTALKVAQLNLLKQNFVLGHAEISRENPAWKKESARVGDEQATLGQKTDEAVAQFIAKGVAANIVDLLQQSRTLMGTSAGEIHAAKNLEALPVQGKSLSLITEIEKYFIHVAAKDGSGKGPKQVNDPFEKPKAFEMKQRFDTVAGGLEALAQAQLELAQELARADPKNPDAGKPTPEPPDAGPKKPDPNRIEGTFTERQTLIAQRIGALLNGQALPPEVNTHLEGGQGHARESLRQLDAEDIVQAREPAAAAARELRLAAQTMDRLGEDNANDKLADALNRLNRAAETAREAGDVKSEDEARRAADEAAAQAAEAREKLADAARQQQETGSAQAAARLADAVRALDDPKLRDVLKKWHDQPQNPARAQEAAEQLARAAEQIAGQRGGNDSAEEIAKLVERVERTRQNFERLAAASPAARRDEDAAGNQPARDPLAPPKGEARQPASLQSQGKAPSGKDGKGKDGQGKGASQQGKGDNPGQGKSEQGKRQGQGKGDGPGQSKSEQGKGQGQGTGDNPGQDESDQGEGRGQGKGQGRSEDRTGQSQGQGQGPGQADGQSGEGSTTGGSTRAGQPTSRSSRSSDLTGHGHGGRSSPVDPASNGNAEAPTSYEPVPDHRGETGDGGSQGNTPRSAAGLEYSPSMEREARELLADLHDETLEARVVLPGPDAGRVLEELRPDVRGSRSLDTVAIVASYARIRAPLDRLIALLQGKLERSQRQHELTDQNQEKAPPAYGDAVADYFEQLSRDYQPSSSPAPADAPGAGTSPEP